MSDALAPHSSIIPGVLDCPSLNMLAGASGIGKTALLASLMAAFRDGGLIFGHTAHTPAGVGYISTDRPWSGTYPWFERAGYIEFPNYSLVDDVSFDVKQLHGGKHGPDHFVHCVEQLQLPAGSLIVVDPIALFLGGKLNDYTSVSIACIAIQRYLIEKEYCVIGVCHTSKLKADVSDRYARPQDRILGSGALLGYSATQMYFMGPDESGRDDGQYTFLWNPHLRPSEEFLVKRVGGTGLFNIAEAYPVIISMEELAEPGVPRQRNIRLQARLDAVYSLIPENGEVIGIEELKGLVLAMAPPVPRTTLYRYLTILEEDQRIIRMGDGLYRRAKNPQLDALFKPSPDGGETPAPKH